MKEEELQMIRDHIEIHARREPRAIKITQILWKAVEELEAIKKLQKENYIQEQIIIGDQIEHDEEVKKLKERLEEARHLIQCASCVHQNSPCDRNDYPKDKDTGLCTHYSDVIDEVEKLKEDIKTLSQNFEDTEIINKALEEQNEILKRRIARAKECMKSFIYIAKSEHFNCNGLIKNAEDFIYDRMCPLRKQGQHCITEKPCIMCDRS